MKTLIFRMLELAATRGFENLSPAEQDRRFERLLSGMNRGIDHGRL